MKASRYALLVMPVLSFISFCSLSALPGHATNLEAAETSQTRGKVEALSGEWRVTCEVKSYKDGRPSSSVNDRDESLVAVETDADGSYELYKFPVGFGEGLPRLRKVTSELYAGDDTVNGITTVITQSAALHGEKITFRQTVIDARSKRTESETSCTGARSKSPLTVDGANVVLSECVPTAKPNPAPNEKLARTYKSVGPFSDGLAAAAIVSKGTRSLKWGYIDESGRVVIPMRYDVVSSFRGGLAAVGKYYGRGRNLKYGVVEKLGPQVTPHVNFDAVKILGEGFAAVGYVVPAKPGLKWNLINRENTLIFHGFDEIGCFNDGRAPASYTDGTVTRTGYVNRAGEFSADKK